MIIRNSQRVPPCSARESRPADTTGAGRGNFNHTPARERLIDAERGNPVLHDLANKTSARILIETEVNGRVDLFQYFPFHRRTR